MSYAVFDLETSTKVHMKRKASPFHPDNIIVAAGWKRKAGVVEGEYYGRKGPRKGWFTSLLAGTTMLVGQNIAFDILYAIRDPENLAAWMKWIADGGQIWCCQIAEYLLRGMEPSSHMVSMDDIIGSYGGNIKIDEVKALWEAGVATEDIDPDLLMRYLCGTMEGPYQEQRTEDRAHGDIGNTELIFLGQLAKARKTGQVKSIMMNCMARVCTAEMERNGLYVDRKLGYELADVLARDLERCREELSKFLPDNLPFEFNWGNRYHLSPLIFGGTVKYQKRVQTLDEDGNKQYFQKDEEHYILSDGSTVACQYFGISDGQDDHRVRFAGGKNKGEFKTKKVKVPDLERGPKTAMRDFWFEFPGYTAPEKEWASSTEGLYSTASEVIEQLGGRDIAFLKTLANVAKMNKDLGTYFISTDEKTGEKKGMLTLVGDDGIIHHSLNHTSTVTARLSSNSPNLQNVSKGTLNDPQTGKYCEVNGVPDGSQIKRVFVSRFGGDGVIVQSDFTALEVYVQAILTSCRQLIEDLRMGLDMHCVRVSQKEKIPYAEAVRLCVEEAVPAWKKKRTEAKVFSFQRAYGAGPQKIADSTGMSIEDVKALIAAEEERYPELSKYNADKTDRIKASRRPTTNIQQHPEIPGLSCQLGRGFSVTPDNKVYSYRESPSPAWAVRGGAMPQSFSPTEIANYEAQGAGGEWTKAAMSLAGRAFYARGNFGGKAFLINNVHDALYLDAHKSVSFEAAALLHACMLAASDYIEWWFNWKVPVPVPSVTSYGRNLMEEKGFGEGFEELAQQYRVDLRKQYMNGYTPSFVPN